MRLLLMGCQVCWKELVPTLLNQGHEIYVVSRKNINKLNKNLDLEI